MDHNKEQREKPDPKNLQTDQDLGSLSVGNPDQYHSLLIKKLKILSLGLQEGCPSYLRNLPSKENIQHFKT
jgi:hypothetical protein